MGGSRFRCYTKLETAVAGVRMLLRIIESKAPSSFYFQCRLPLRGNHFLKISGHVRILLTYFTFFSSREYTPWGKFLWRALRFSEIDNHSCYYTLVSGNLRACKKTTMNQPLIVGSFDWKVSIPLTPRASFKRAYLLTECSIELWRNNFDILRSSARLVSLIFRVKRFTFFFQRYHTYFTHI